MTTRRRLLGLLKGHRVLGLFVGLSIVASGSGTWASFAEVNDSQAAQHREQVAAQKAGEAVEAKLCGSFAKLAAEHPPAGNATANPSRAFEQGQHSILVSLGPDIGCKRQASGVRR